MIYVDPIRETKPSGRWPFYEGCHLWGDSLAELLSFAGRIGLAPYWLHTVRGWPHFDLTALKRSQAIEAGALEVSSRQAVAARRKATRTTNTRGKG